MGFVFPGCTAVAEINRREPRTRCRVLLQHSTATDSVVVDMRGDDHNAHGRRRRNGLTVKRTKIFPIDLLEVFNSSLDRLNRRERRPPVFAHHHGHAISVRHAPYTGSSWTTRGRSTNTRFHISNISSA